MNANKFFAQAQNNPAVAAAFAALCNAQIAANNADRDQSISQGYLDSGEGNYGSWKHSADRAKVAQDALDKAQAAFNEALSNAVDDCSINDWS